MVLHLYTYRSLYQHMGIFNKSINPNKLEIKPKLTYYDESRVQNNAISFFGSILRLTCYLLEYLQAETSLFIIRVSRFKNNM